jgi:diaminopimelate epimerase
VGDSLIDAPSLMLGKVETMYETQSSIVGFVCTKPSGVRADQLLIVQTEGHA